MSASIFAYWPGITEEQINSQPGFYNDYKAWSDWLIMREREPEVVKAIRRLNADAIRTSTTAGIRDDEVDWVTPSELRNAALRLIDAVREGGPDIQIILDSYEDTANDIDPIPEEFIRDLLDIATIATWAEDQGATKMTLQVNW
jgi:hypothetical protein